MVKPIELQRRTLQQLCGQWYPAKSGNPAGNLAGARFGLIWLNWLATGPA